MSTQSPAGSPPAEETAEQPCPADRAEAILDAVITHKGGTRREGQVQMARSVAESLAAQKPLMIEGGTGVGKALDVETPIATPTGFVPIGKIVAGDHVFGVDGRPHPVTEAFDVMYDRPCYEVAFSDGTVLVADADHQWNTATPQQRRAFAHSASPDPWNLTNTVTTSDIGDTLTVTDTDRANHAVPLAAALQPDTAVTPAWNPYTVGSWLANPDRPHAAPDMVAAFQDRRIPPSYMFGAYHDRVALLAGLLDRSGTIVGSGQVQLAKAAEGLIRDVQVLACTLGYRATVHPRRNGSGSNVWVLAFTPSTQVFNDPTKSAALHDAAPLGSRRTRYRSIVGVQPVPSRPVRCIAVDSPHHLYLAGESLIPTHNSLAYLAGAVSTGKQVVVATHTKALQDQLVGDLDSVISALDNSTTHVCDHTPTYGVIKGRSSYLCLSKVKGDAERDDGQGTLVEEDTHNTSTPLGRQVKGLSEWAENTDSGDRADAPSDVSQKAWEQVSVSADQCTGKACPFHEEACFAERARRRARDADVIVVNQALLAMAMRFPLLPDDVGAIVIDEAHEFDSVVADTFGARVTIDRLRSAAKSATGIGETGRAQVEDIQERLAKEIDTLDASVPPPKDKDRALIARADVTRNMQACAAAFARLQSVAGLMPQGDEKQKAKKDLMLRMLENVVFDLNLLCMGTTDKQVAWAESVRGKTVLCSAMFDVSDKIYQNLLEPYRSVVFTSATLTVAQSFDIPAKTYGLTKTPWRSQRVESPFDYEKQGLVWLPEGMPSPRSPDYGAKVARVAATVVEAAGGRTLVLCTSWRAVNEIAEALKAKFVGRYPILVQEPGVPSRSLAQQFIDDTRSVLVGTRTFWTGISVPGSTCSAVVIDKTPFPSPGEPIVAARSEKADQERKGSGFREVYVAQACLTITQGSGRLIRTVTDRGLVVLCDPRVHENSTEKKNYGTEVRKSLPSFPVTTDEAAVTEFLRDLDTADGAPVVRKPPRRRRRKVRV